MPPARKKKSTATRPPKSSLRPSCSPKRTDEKRDMPPSLTDSEPCSKLDALARSHAPLDGEKEKTASPEELFNHNLRFACLIASRWNRKWATLDDLRAAALRGLWDAACRFDPMKAKNAKFISFAKWLINKELSEVELQQTPGIPVSRKVRALLVMQSAGVQMGEKRKRNLSGLHSQSLDALLDTGVDPAPCPTPNPRASLLEAEKPEALNRWMDEALEPRERFVLACIFGLGETAPQGLRPIAKVLGVTYQRVEQIEKKALRKLREHRRLQKDY